MPKPRHFSAVVVGVSAGGVQALKRLLGGLPAAFPLPVLIVQHIAGDGAGLARLLDAFSPLRVKEAEERETLVPGTAYVAPADYHLLVEPDRTLTLSVDPPVSYARPSIDVLFESAAEAFGPGLIGVILTGANADGSRGLARVKAAGGIAVVQDPAEAEVPFMPRSALAATEVDHVLTLAGIAPLLVRLAERTR